MSPDTLIADDRLRRKLVRRRRAETFIIALCVVVACAGGLFVLHRVLESQRHNAQRIERTDDKASVAKTQAQKTASKAQAADQRSKRVIQYLRGERGIPGVPGKNGVKGARGPAGTAGERGPRGPRGAPGRDAAPTTQADLLSVLAQFCSSHNCRGPQGVPGMQGPAGATGPAGPTGPPGPSMQRAFAVTFPRSDGSAATLNCADPEGDGTYLCAPAA